MAFFDWLFGSEAGEGEALQSTNTSVSTNEIPGYITDASKQLLNSGRRVIAQPYENYGGDRVAGLSGDSQAGINAIRGIGPQAQQRVNQGYNTAGASMAPVTSGEINQRMNPYMTNVIGQAAREVRRDADIQGQSINQAAQNAGAFGGSRHGVVEANQERDVGRNITDLYERGYASAYDRASQYATDDRERALQTGRLQAALGAQGQSLGSQAAQQQLGIGALQEQRQQQQMDVGYQDFLAEKQYPYDQLNFFNRLISNQPYSTTQNTSSTFNSPAPESSGFFQTAAGLGIAGLGTVGKYTDWLD